MRVSRIIVLIYFSYETFRLSDIIKGLGYGRLLVAEAAGDRRDAVLSSDAWKERAALISQNKRRKREGGWCEIKRHSPMGVRATHLVYYW
jgi:hypothetical protein